MLSEAFCSAIGPNIQPVKELWEIKGRHRSSCSAPQDNFPHFKKQKTPNTTVIHLDLCHRKGLSAVIGTSKMAPVQYGSQRPNVATLNVASPNEKSDF